MPGYGRVGCGGLSSRFNGTSQILPPLVQRPQTFYSRTEQADKATVIRAFIFWGCTVPNFRAKLPFHGMS